MEISAILSELENHTGKLPRLALEAAMQEQEAITPHLLDALQQSITNYEELLEQPDYFLHIYALFLLAQFREAKSYPLIVNFFSIPEDISLDLTGDVVTEYLARILASVCHGNIEPIKQLIENVAVNEYVRGAALDSLVVLMVQESISREELIQYLEKLFLTNTEKDNYYFWGQLVAISCDICAIELEEHINRVFEEDLVEQFFITKDNVKQAFEKGIEISLNELRSEESHTLINNTISELETWYSFREHDDKDHTKIGFIPKSNKKKSKSNKKKNMQKESRKKNRSKKR